MGAEVFGYADVYVEAEMLLLNQRFWDDLGVADNVTLELNNIGDAEARAHFKQALVSYISLRIPLIRCRQRETFRVESTSDIRQ